MPAILTYFGRTLHTEVLKSRYTLALWLTLLYPFCIVALVTLSVIGIDFGDTNPWTRFVFNIGNLGAFFLPFYIVLLTGFYCYIEHKSNTWKHLLSQPVPRWSLYYGKLAMIIVLLLLSMGLLMLFSLAAALLLNLSKENFSFQPNAPDFYFLFLKLLKSYLAALLLLSVQYCLSIRMKNLILPLIIGIGLIIVPLAVTVILGMTGLLKEAKLIDDIFRYDPWSYPFAHIFNFMAEMKKEVDIFPVLSRIYLVLAMLVSALGLLDFRRKNVK